MGTRADFYVGRGKDAEWLGSIGWDGYPDGMPDGLFDVADEGEWRGRISAFLAEREDGTKPEQGWPWPWDDSGTTDYAYAFDGGKVYLSSFGEQWQTLEEEQARAAEPEPPDLPKTATFPNMKERKNVTLGKRSGLIIVGT
jgi:hypothetical protein